jgi:hypothetical protein
MIGLLSRPDLDAACRAYDLADARLIRTSRADRAFDRLFVARHEAHADLVRRLGHVVHHCDGKAYWVERGELNRRRLVPIDRRHDRKDFRHSGRA